MNAPREPSAPPDIPGLEPVRLLGTGGSADVHLYTQTMPRRSVAVKVLLPCSVEDDARERFRTEAGLMAQLSHHPSIVTILHADVAADGRPFLVMEYCSRPGLGQRYRTERMSVAEVLRIGVRLASAVETTHRAGILHRDIKPANVLVTDFGWPALTDFGIAGTGGSALGMSIPWSPPELLAAEPAGDARSDVYSLAATVYSLLAGRSPFEVPGGPNGAADLVARIEGARLAPTGRADVPDSLHVLLARAMDRDPGRRPSALALARALQGVEAELLLPVTPLDLAGPDRPADGVPAPDSAGTASAGTASADRTAPGPRGAAGRLVAGDTESSDEAGQATRLRPVRSIAPAPVRPAPDGGEPAAQNWVPAPAETDRRSAGEPSNEGSAPGPLAAQGAHRGPARALAGALAGVLVVTAVGAGVVLATRGDVRPAAAPAPVTSASAAVVRAVPSPEGLRGSVAPDGAVVFSWTNPDPQEGDTYLWGPVEAGQEPTLTAVGEPTVTVVPAAPGETCIEVSIVRADRRYSTRPAVGCAGA